MNTLATEERGPADSRDKLPRVRADLHVSPTRAMDSSSTLIDQLLAEQQSLTAVERFAKRNGHSNAPAQEKYYRDLIPFAKPRPGEQYAFLVDLDKCSGCKACVSACHSLNGLEENEMWRSTGLLIGESVGLIHSGAEEGHITPKTQFHTPSLSSEDRGEGLGEEARLQACPSPRTSPHSSVVGKGWQNLLPPDGLDGLRAKGRSGIPKSPSLPIPYLQTVTTACHHCVEPACAHGCPVLAYEKDPATGIVRHLDDQCIGCQYCVLKCPYDVPKYSAKKGIVRKCDMCHSRLAVGEAPACVQACPSEAIRIEIVQQQTVRAETASLTAEMLPGAFASNYTSPSTRYVSAKPLPKSARPADADALRLEQPHWPLIIMLVLTQLAAGLHLSLVALLAAGVTAPARVLALAALAALFAGLGASVLHLGRPLKAWRAFLGWLRSWMSREIIGFTSYAAFAGALAWRPDNFALALATCVIAMAGVTCSVMIYVDTRRPAWAARLVFPSFLGTTFVLGSATGAVLCWPAASSTASALLSIATVVRVLLYTWESMLSTRALSDPDLPQHRAALTALRLARPALVARTVLFVAATVLSALAIFNAGSHGYIWAMIACATTLVSQFIERWLFFVACPAPRMPGGVPA